MRSSRPREIFNKITILIVGSSLITGIILIKLFQLQLIDHNRYQEMAQASQFGLTELPAQRGEIIIKDFHSNEEFSIATNTTLNLLYADPTIIKDPQYVSDKIAPLIFNIEEERATDEERRNKLARNLASEMSQEEIDTLLRPLTDEELETNFRKDLIEKIGQITRTQIILGEDVDEEMIADVSTLNLAGIEIKEKTIYAYPAQIKNLGSTAKELAPALKTAEKRLTTILEGKNRYVVLRRKLDPDLADELKKMIKEEPNQMLAGLGMKEEYFRFYPEGSLGANIIGYVNNANVGQYGIESSFNTQLQGVTGKLQTKKDSIGRQITVGESTLEAAIDGDDIVLTIDRSIQLTVEKILEAAVKEYQADNGQVIIMNPQTGAIISMAHYPSFDPNHYGDVFKKVEIHLSPEEIENLVPTKNEGVYNFYINEVTLDKYPVFEVKDENGNTRYHRYENFRGPDVYHNKIVTWPYEPGSVFKSIAMASAIDDGDVTPNTTFNDIAPIGVDFNVYSQEYDFEIKNSEGEYFGLINMSTVLAKSLNTGMTFVAKKMGPSLFYSYLKKFGFLDRTDIEFEGESIGQIEYFDNWTESELATHAFGQGITVTMIQLANAYSVIANGGILMQPYVVEEVRHDNELPTKIEPQQIRRVISEETSSQMSAMLLNAVENGVANQAKVAGHFIAGKTGTSQTYKYGRALSGKGTTIASFAGFAPINNPQFVVLVKFDHPRSNEWGSSTAAPTFSKIAEYLFSYYNIQPDK